MGLKTKIKTSDVKLRKLRCQNNDGRRRNGRGGGTQGEEGHLDKERDERTEERYKRKNRMRKQIEKRET